LAERCRDDGVSPVGVHLQAGTLRPGQHPDEGIVPERPLVVRIAAADIRMHARKPALLDLLISTSPPQFVLPKEPSALVQRDGMPGNVHTGVAGGEAVSDRIPYPADR